MLLLLLVVYADLAKPFDPRLEASLVARHCAEASEGVIQSDAPDSGLGRFNSLDTTGRGGYTLAVTYPSDLSSTASNTGVRTCVTDLQSRPSMWPTSSPRRTANGIPTLDRDLTSPLHGSAASLIADYHRDTRTKDMKQSTPWNSTASKVASQDRLLTSTIVHTSDGRPSEPATRVTQTSLRSEPSPSKDTAGPASNTTAKNMTNHQAVVYWGQHGGNTRENSDLAAYCKPDSGIDIVVLAFLFTYGNGLTTPSGTIGQSCTITSEGQAQGCDGLAAAIDHCKSRGVKVLLSLGGAVGAYSLRSQEEAEAIGQRLWDAYGNTDSKNVSRPFGKTFVDGWDFDLENSDGSQYYGHLIAKLRSNFVSDPGGRYLVTGAPQCPVPEPNMHAAIKQAKFDYLFVQFYNNPTCSVDGHINYNEWKHYIANAPSADAKIFFGVPAAPLAATGSQSGARYYLQPAALASLIRAYKTDDAFGGVMLWSAAHSDGNVIGGKTYAQHVKNMLGLG